MNKHLLIAAASLLVGGATVEVHAQVTTASINGTITDASTKEALIGASVVVRHLPTGTVSGAAANAKGNFIISGLRPGGPYQIEVSYIGYQTATIKNVSLSLGESETFNIKLQDDSKALSQVVVTGKKGSTFNATRTGAGSAFSRAAIDRTPSVSRSVFDIAKLTPQANAGSSGTSFAGSSNRYNSFQIDGTVNNDVFGLSSTGTNGGQTGTTPISLEAIEAVQVVIAPFDVRQSGFTGGGINAITKSGSNTLKGSVYDYYYNQNFYGTTAGKDVQNRKKVDALHNNTLGFTLGGALVKDKLFFFVNGEMVDKSTPSTSYLDWPNSPVKEADALSVQQRLGELSAGYAPGFGSIDRKSRSYKALARLDWNISQAHRLTLRYSYVQGTKDTYSSYLNNLNFNDRLFTYYSKTHSLVGELNSRFSNALSNELRIGYTGVRDHRQPTNPLFPAITIKNVGGSNGTIEIGSDRYSAANELSQDVFTLSDNLTYTFDNHTLTAGTHNELFNVYNLFISNNTGYYVYRNIEDFVKGATPQEYYYSYALESVTGSKRWGPRFGAAQLGFYLQDEWKATDRLRVTLGLRADIPLFFDKPTANEYFNSSAIAQQYDVANNTMPKTRVLWSPRLGFRYSLDEARKYLLRGGVGIFTGRVPLVWISNSFSNTGVEYSRTELRSARDFAAHPNFHFSADPSNQYSSSPANGQRVTSEIDMVRRDFKFPQVVRANLALDATLPGDIKATIEGMYTKTLNNLKYTNLRVSEAAGQGLQQGNLVRPLYTSLPISNDNPYTSLIVLGNTSKGYTYNITAQLSKDFAYGLSASLAYTYGVAKSANDANSSQAYSGWQYNYTFLGPNTEELSDSQFELRNRIVGTLSYRKEYGKHFATSVGLTYNGQNGARYSLIYNGDINGDGVRGNDLLYIPTTEDIKSMNFGKSQPDPANKGKYVIVQDQAMAQALEDYLSSNPDLVNRRGQVAPRNGFVMPFVHKFDLHVAQDFFFNVGGRRHTIQLNADILNVGNLLCRNWGLERTLNYSYQLLGYSKVNTTSGPQDLYTFSIPKEPRLYGLSDLASRWQAQVGIKYIF